MSPAVLDKKIYKFMLNELSSMKDNVRSNYNDNIKNRENNDFLAFSDDNVKKYMALGRSVDAQLGNRIQRIIFYIARMRYGEINVPNIVSINISDETKRNIEVSLYSIPFDLDKEDQKSNFDPYNQKIFVSKELSDDSVKKMLKVKKRCNALLCQAFEINGLSSDNFNAIKNAKKETLVDLLFFDLKNNKINGVSAFEIKMGGNLDTKNAKSNAEEVRDLFKLLNFINKTTSHFATCYGTCSQAVKNKIDKVRKKVGAGESIGILNGSDFWEKILPDSFAYDDFIKNYKKAFKNSGLEDELKKL